jgi:hypothetical protein
MAIDFPSSPTNGQVYQGYYYDSSKSAWRSLATSVASVVTSPTTPTGATAGDLWFNNNDGTLYVYYNDGLKSFWTEIKANSALTTTIDDRVTLIEAGNKKIPGYAVQTVQGILADPVTFTTANAWTAVGLSATIIPKFSTSKILVSVHMGIGGNGGTNYDAGFGLFRDSTQIALPNSPGSRLQSFLPFGQRSDALYEMSTVSNSYLDSPATVSAITYSLKAFSTNTNTHYINRTGSDSDGNGDNRMISTITLMEVAQ